MAGDYRGPGHRIVSGEVPVVGLEVITNNLDRGTITALGRGKFEDGKYGDMNTVTCGWYCEAWHEVTLHTSHDGKPLSGTTIMNCDRLTTRMPR